MSEVALPSCCGGFHVTRSDFARVPRARRTESLAPQFLSRGGGTSPSPTYQPPLLPQRRVQMQQVFQVKVIDTQVQVRAAKSHEKQNGHSERRRGGRGLCLRASRLGTSHGASWLRILNPAVCAGSRKSPPKFTRRTQRGHLKPACDRKGPAAWSSRTNQEDSEGARNETNISGRWRSGPALHVTVLRAVMWTLLRPLYR